ERVAVCVTGREGVASVSPACRQEVTQRFTASLVLLVVSATASADQGGMTISSAPELPLGRSFASTVSASATLGKVCATEGRSGEFWRVSMNAFDHLVVDFGSSNGDVVGPGLYRVRASYPG